MLPSDLVEVQRGVVTQGTDGGQFNQGIMLGALHWFAILEPEEKHRTSISSHRFNVLGDLAFHFHICLFGNQLYRTHTSPSGA